MFTLYYSCEHEHEDACVDCERVDKVIERMNDHVAGIRHEGERERAQWRLTTAAESIFSWMKHVMRRSQQRLGRLVMMKDLKDGEGKITDSTSLM